MQIFLTIIKLGVSKLINILRYILFIFFDRVGLPVIRTAEYHFKFKFEFQIVNVSSSNLLYGTDETLKHKIILCLIVLRM